jgi:hypothetical protein
MIAIQKAGELPKTMFPTERRATIQPVLTAVAVLFLILLSHAAVADTGWQNLDDVSAVKVLPQGVEVEAGGGPSSGDGAFVERRLRPLRLREECFRRNRRSPCCPPHFLSR